MLKYKDPSDIFNDINGFDIIQCNGLQNVQAVIVFPNIGYGFLSTMCARMARDKGRSTPGKSMSYTIISGKDLRETAKDVNTVSAGKELFMPVEGMDMKMFVTGCNLNDVCSRESSLFNDIVLPIPMKVSIREPNSFTTSLETMTYTRSIQESLFRGYLDICSSASANASLETTIGAAAAGQVLRTFSALLDSDKEKQWTGKLLANDERIEYAHLSAELQEDIESTEAWDAKLKKTTVPPSPSDLFVRPFVAVLATTPNGNKRLYYSEELSERLFQTRIMGTSTPPKLICENTIYLLDPDDNGNSSPAWATIVGSSAIESSTGISYNDYWKVASPLGRINSVFNSADIYHPDTFYTWDFVSNSEDTKTVELYTFRPPVFTSGGLIVDIASREGPYRLLFSSAYYYPVASIGYGDPSIISNPEIIGDLMFRNPLLVDDKSWVSGSSYEIGDLLAHHDIVYKCISNYTSTKDDFYLEIDHWEHVGYSQGVDMIPFNEGFCHLSYAIDMFISILEMTSTISATSCLIVNTSNSIEITDYMSEIGVSPSRLSTGEPYTLYTTSIGDAIKSKPLGDPDEMFMAPSSAGRSVLNHREHIKVGGDKLPGEIDTITKWLDTLINVMNTSPSAIDIDEDRIYPYGMRKSAKYIIGPKVTSASADIDRGRVIPVGSYGETEETVVSPMDRPSTSNIEDDGEISIASLLSTSSGFSTTIDMISIGKSVVESIPPAVQKVSEMAENLLIEVDTYSNFPIISPMPLFKYDFTMSGEVDENTMYITPLDEDDSKFSEYMSVVRTILSSTPSDSLPGILSETSNGFKQGMHDLNAIITGKTKSNAMAIPATSNICKALSYCHDIIDILETSVISERDYGSECTAFMTKHSRETSNCILAVPRGYSGKGLWYYNLRKSYYVLKSSINIVKALIEKAYTVFAGVSNGFCQAPFPATSMTGFSDTATNDVSYHDLDLAIFHGHADNKVYPVIRGEDAWPEYDGPSNRDEEYGIISLEGISNKAILNNISSFFSPKTIGYEMTVDFSGPSQISAKSEPLFIMGSGLGSEDTSMGTQEQLPYISRDNIKPVDSSGIGWNTLTSLTEDDIQAKVKFIQDLVSKSDHITRDGSKVVKYTNAEGAVVTSNYTSIANLKSRLIDGNLSSVIAILGKPPVSAFIDMGHVFPYLGDYSEATVFAPSINVDFNTAQPRYISDITEMNHTLLTIDPEQQDNSDLTRFFGCKATSTGAEVGADVLFSNWNADRVQFIDSVISEIVKRLNSGTWLHSLVQDPSKPYTISFVGFTDPATATYKSGRVTNLSIGTNLLIRYLLEYGHVSGSEYSESSLIEDMAKSDWNTQDGSSSNSNQNLMLSKRRSFIIAKYIIGQLLLRSETPAKEGGFSTATARDGSIYKAIIFNHTGPFSTAAAAVNALSDTGIYKEYKNTGVWEGVYITRVCKPYAFGDITGNAFIGGKEGQKPQRTVVATLPHPGEIPESITINPSGNRMGIYCKLPLGKEFADESHPSVELSRSTMLYPEAKEVIRTSDKLQVKWRTNPSYESGDSYLTDNFTISGDSYTRFGSDISVLSYTFRYLGAYMGNGVSYAKVDDMVAKIAENQSIKESVVKYAEDLVSKCFKKTESGAPSSGDPVLYTNYGKAFHAHSSCLDNIWLLVVKKI